MRKKWNRINLLRLRRWVKLTKYLAALILIAAFGFAGCAAHAHVLKMTECGRRTVESTVTVCGK